MAASPLDHEPDLPGPPVLGFIACGALVRRDAFLAAGGFHRRFGVGGEEQLLAIDLATAGWGLAYVDTIVAHHHPSPVRDHAARRRRVVCNDLWMSWLLEALRGVGWVLRERRVVPAHLETALRRLER